MRAHSREQGRGGWWVAAQAALLIAVVGLGWLMPGNDWPLVARISGWILLLLAAVVGVAGAVALGANLSPFPKPRAGSQLVQTGIYGLVRHPLYTALILASVGWGLLRASWPGLLVSLVLFVFLDAKARREEQWLREKFQDEYRDYEQRVKKFVPGIY